MILGEGGRTLQSSIDAHCIFFIYPPHMLFPPLIESATSFICCYVSVLGPVGIHEWLPEVKMDVVGQSPATESSTH